MALLALYRLVRTQNRYAPWLSLTLLSVGALGCAATTGQVFVLLIRCGGVHKLFPPSVATLYRQILVLALLMLSNVAQIMDSPVTGRCWHELHKTLVASLFSTRTHRIYRYLNFRFYYSVAT
jgi:hypothetical protein